ncbi:hypothetical protein ACIFOT_28475 [Neobacillus sp. NRS-1170]|uniref:hypothetical protein n=1 Tax=Neobacillus sp. NRS-1170 TaxID=3233898 RepID=UPI003D295D61
MRNRIAFWLILVLLFSLSACESENDVDQIVRDYVKKEYGIGVTIKKREDVNEGNMGERTFVLKSKEEIPVTFEVHLKGLFSSRVTGDDYQKQKKAAILGNKFWNVNKSELEMLGFHDVEFSFAEGLHVSSIYEKDINLYDDKSVSTLIHFIGLLNAYNPSPDSLTLKTKSLDFPIELLGLSRLSDKETLKAVLFNDYNIVNVSLFQRDYDKFKAIEEGVEKRGYQLEFGLTVGAYDQSFYCFKENLNNRECNGGYTVGLKGGKSDRETLFDLVLFLKSQPIRISNVAFHDRGIYLKLDDINSPQQIVIESE